MGNGEWGMGNRKFLNSLFPRYIPCYLEQSAILQHSACVMKHKLESSLSMYHNPIPYSLFPIPQRKAL